jgi:hypothetical protein
VAARVLLVEDEGAAAGKLDMKGEQSEVDGAMQDVETTRRPGSAERPSKWLLDLMARPM